MRSTSRYMTPARPPSSGWAASTSAQPQDSPCSSRFRLRKNGDAIAVGCPAEQTSWTRPGTVSSAERMPPPISSFASRTVTSSPACASTIAAASPFGPEPITTAVVMHQPRASFLDSLRGWQKALPAGAPPGASRPARHRGGDGGAGMLFEITMIASLCVLLQRVRSPDRADRRRSAATDRPIGDRASLREDAEIIRVSQGERHRMVRTQRSYRGAGISSLPMPTSTEIFDSTAPYAADVEPS